MDRFAVGQRYHKAPFAWERPPGLPQGGRIWKFCGGSPASPSPGGGACGRRLLSSPLQGGGREGGPAPGCAGVPPASREAQTRMTQGGGEKTARPPCPPPCSAIESVPPCPTAAPLTPPLPGGRSGGGSPPLGAPASRRPRAKRERGCGPSARHAGGTLAHPGNSPMGGIGKVPVRAAEPLGQPPSLPPPFQGGGAQTTWIASCST